MSARRFFYFFLPVFIYLAVIFYCSSIPALHVVHDKLIHFLVYGGLGFGVTRLCVSLWPDKILRAFAVGVLFSALFGAGDELHQFFVPEREMSGFDWLSDFLGSLLGSAFYVVVHWIQRRQSRC